MLLVEEVVTCHLTRISAFLPERLGLPPLFEGTHLVAEGIRQFAPGRFVFNGMDGHDPEGASVERPLPFNDGIDGPVVGMVDLLLLVFFLDLRQVVGILLFLLQRLFPYEINSTNKIVPSWIYKVIRLAGYIFLLSTL